MVGSNKRMLLVNTIIAFFNIKIIIPGHFEVHGSNVFWKTTMHTRNKQDCRSRNSSMPCTSCILFGSNIQMRARYMIKGSDTLFVILSNMH